MNGEEKPRQRRSDTLINRLLETHFPTVFHTVSALSAPAGHLPREGKADDTRENFYQETFGHRPIYIRGASIFYAPHQHSSLLTPHF